MAFWRAGKQHEGRCGPLAKKRVILIPVMDPFAPPILVLQSSSVNNVWFAEESSRFRVHVHTNIFFNFEIEQKGFFRTKINFKLKKNEHVSLMMSSSSRDV